VHEVRQEKRCPEKFNLPLALPPLGSSTPVLHSRQSPQTIRQTIAFEECSHILFGLCLSKNAFALFSEFYYPAGSKCLPEGAERGYSGARFMPDPARRSTLCDILKNNSAGFS